MATMMPVIIILKHPYNPQTSRFVIQVENEAEIVDKVHELRENIRRHEEN